MGVLIECGMMNYECGMMNYECGIMNIAMRRWALPYSAFRIPNYDNDNREE
jgi:hypothetical protein